LHRGDGRENYRKKLSSKKEKIPNQNANKRGERRGRTPENHGEKITIKGKDTEKKRPCGKKKGGGEKPYS